MKQMLQNPSRFAVRVFRTPTASAFPYPSMAAKVDLGYRSVQQSEQQRYAPRYVSSSSLMPELNKTLTLAVITTSHTKVLGYGVTTTLFILVLQMTPIFMSSQLVPNLTYFPTQSMMLYRQRLFLLQCRPTVP